MKKIICILLTVFVIFTLSSCSGTSKIGTIDGKNVSVEEFNYFLYNVKQDLLFEADVMEEGAETFWQTEVEGKKAIELAKEKAFEEVMSFEAKYLKAVENGYVIDDNCRQKAEEQYNDVVSSQGGKSELKTFLKEMGSSEKAYKEILEKNNCIISYINEYKKSSNEFDVSQEEIYQRIYEYYGEKGPITSLVAKQIIFVTVDDDAKALPDEEIQKKKALADSIHQRIQSGEDFDTLMKEYSEDPELESNLDGYVILKSDASDEMFEKAFILEDGEVSPVVKSDYGYHIMKVIKKNYSTMESLTENIKIELEAEKESALAEVWKKDYSVTRNDEEFTKIK